MNKGITVSRRSPDGKTFNSDFARLEELRGGVCNYFDN